MGKSTFFAISLVYISTSILAQKACFDDCWTRMNKSSSLFASIDILKEIEGCQAPEFNVESIEGDVISLKSFTDSVIVMNFWFIGCKPCIEEMPRLNELVDLYNGKNVVFLSFARDSKQDIETKFLPKHQFKYKIVPGRFNISKTYCVQPYPTHIVIGKSGKVELATFDSVAKDENYNKLRSSIDNALAEQ
jgi:peroxiredoxin